MTGITITSIFRYFNHHFLLRFSDSEFTHVSVPQLQTQEAAKCQPQWLLTSDIISNLIILFTTHMYYHSFLFSFPFISTFVWGGDTLTGKWYTAAFDIFWSRCSSIYASTLATMRNLYKEAHDTREGNALKA